MGIASNRLSGEIYRGRGLAIKLLFDEVSKKIRPLDPDNKLIFMTGPLAGTGVPGSSRVIVSTKSPLTGIYTYAIAASIFGLTLKRSGYDGVIIEGKSLQPVYLFIDEEKASIRDAKCFLGCQFLKQQGLSRRVFTMVV